MFDKIDILHKYTLKNCVCQLSVKWRQNQTRQFSPKTGTFLFLELQWREECAVTDFEGVIKQHSQWGRRKEEKKGL